MNSPKGVKSGVLERVSIFWPTCGTRHDLFKITGNQAYVTVGKQTLQHMWYRCVIFVNKVCMTAMKFLKSIYAYGIGWSARWVYLSTSVWIQPEPERRGLDSDTSAEIAHLARQLILYAFSRMLQVFWTCLGYFYGHIYDTYTEMCLSRYWCHNGEGHQECENIA